MTDKDGDTERRTAFWKRVVDEIVAPPAGFVYLSYNDAHTLMDWTKKGCCGNLGQSLDDRVVNPTSGVTLSPDPLLTREELAAEMPAGDPGTEFIHTSLPNLLMVLRKKLDPISHDAACAAASKREKKVSELMALLAGIDRVTNEMGCH